MWPQKCKTCNGPIKQRFCRFQKAHNTKVLSGLLFLVQTEVITVFYWLFFSFKLKFFHITFLQQCEVFRVSKPRGSQDTLAVHKRLLAYRNLREIFLNNLGLIAIVNWMMLNSISFFLSFVLVHFLNCGLLWPHVTELNCHLVNFMKNCSNTKRGK